MADLIDLVDKKKLIRNIHQILDKHINASADYPAELFEIKHELLGSIDIEQSFFTQDSVNRWIPCSERMPEQDREVLVCCYGSDLILTQEGETITEAVERTRREIVHVTVGFIGSDGWYGADWFPMMVTPTYWMPLPEPPEGGATSG